MLTRTSVKYLQNPMPWNFPILKYTFIYTGWKYLILAPKLFIIYSLFFNNPVAVKGTNVTATYHKESAPKEIEFLYSFQANDSTFHTVFAFHNKQSQRKLWQCLVNISHYYHSYTKCTASTKKCVFWATAMSTYWHVSFNRFSSWSLSSPRNHGALKFTIIK